MARTSKNNRAKRSLDKSSCDQKENRPKKVHKPNPDDSIAMSKQLLQKKNTTKNNTRAKRQTKSNNRLCGNGKIMPTLADLEKMFEDSDEDSDDNPAETNNNKVLETPLSPQEQLPPIINTDTLISPSTRTRIKEQVKELLLTIDDSNKHRDNITDQPPKKLLKFETHDLDDLPPLTTNINTDSITGTYSEPFAQNNHNQLESCRSTFGNYLLNMELNDTETNKISVNGNSSDNSSQSSKTTEYISSPCHNISQTGLVSQTFCPLPSTSTNNQIFIKNDELFHRSLQEASLNNSKQDDKKIEASAAMEIPANSISLTNEIKEEQVNNSFNSEITIKNEDLLNTAEVQTSVANDKISENEDTDLQIIEPPTETILILDDDVKHEPSENIDVTESTNDVEIIDSKIQISLIHDDDDCIFIETQTCSHKPTPTVTDVIDLEYEFIEPSFNVNNSLSNNIDDEIIDVDALIAQNQTILNQYNKPESKKLGSSNLVVDVDVSIIAEYARNNSIVIGTEETSDVTPEEPANTSNIQNPVINDVSFVSNHQSPSSSRTIPEMTRRHRDTTQRRRKKKYNRFYPIVINNTHEPDEDSLEGFRRETVHCADRLLECVQSFFKDYRPHHNISTNSSSSNLELPALNLSTNPLSDQIERLQTNDYSITELRHSAPPLLSHKNTNRPTSSSEEIQSTNASVPSSITASTLVNPAPNTHAPKKKRTPVKKNIDPALLTSPAQEKPSGSLGDCPICMETLSGNVIASTICGHVFCMRCLQQAIASNKRCPTCRKILNKKNGYHQIYL